MPHAEITTVGRDRVIGLVTEWNDKELVKMVPSSRWDPDQKIWTTPLSWAACLQLRGLFGERLTVGNDLAVWSQLEVKRRVHPSLELREKITRTDGPFPEKLYDFQTSGAAFLLATGDGGLLGDDLGLGKTVQILAALGALTHLNPADALPALVICPNGVKKGWRDQAEKWESNVHCYVVEGSALKRRKILEEAGADPLALVVVNTESVRLLSRLAPYGSVRLARCRECDKKRGEEKVTPARCEVHLKELNNFGFKTVIMDEAHALKDPKSKQTRAVWAVGHDPSVRRRWALTGTPISNNIGDLWSIMHFIAPLEFSNKSKYLDRYGLMAWNAHGGLDVVGINPANASEFYSILDPRFRRTPKALVLSQLPQIVRPTRWVDMSPKQERAYREMERRLITELDNGDILAAQGNLIKTLRLMQMASSYAETEMVEQPVRDTDQCTDSRNPNPCVKPRHRDHCMFRYKLMVYLREPSTKLDVAMEDIEMLTTKQVVVAAQSRQLIELLAKRLEKANRPHSLYTGAVPDWDRERHKQAFIRGDVGLLLMTIDTGGTGVDGLQVADTMLALQRSWKMIANLQLDGRVHRIGSESHDSVTIVDYVTRGTVEETTLFPRLQEKWLRLEEVNRDRARLMAAGITPEQRYELDRREQELQNAWLGD